MPAPPGEGGQTGAEPVRIIPWMERLPRSDRKLMMSGNMTSVRRAALLLVGLILASGLVGCFGTSSSCERQEKLAATLATDPVFDKIAVPAQSSETYTDTPCEENSGGSLVTAGKRYVLEQALTFEALAGVAAQAADKERWKTIAHIRPTDPGSGGDAHVCFQSVGQERVRYLKFDATVATRTGGDIPEPPFLFAEVSQAEEEIEMCPTPG
jgi:hypothetical protein